jgi:hypothetical protein
MKKVINNIKQLKELLNIEITEKNINLFNYFFKRKGLQIENNKIKYPSIESAKEKNKELDERIKEINNKIRFWKKQKKNAEKYHKQIPVNMIFKKNYWKHKFKKIIDPDYKKDVKESKLNDKILLDPEYQNILEIFLVDPDYRNKLKETINNSIVYKQVNIGEYSIKKQKFKKDNAEHIIAQLNKKLKELEFKKEVAKKILYLVKKYS